METAVTVRDSLPMELTVEEVVAQIQKIQLVMEKAMIRDDPAKGIVGHYGVIPGTNKPTLLKPGAEKLCLLFRLAPEYESVERYDGDHLTIKSKCTLYHIVTGLRLGSGEGSCSTKESKYAYRKGARVCPECGKEAIIKGKAEFGGGWLCFKKKDGCGMKWPDGATEIESQNADRVANEDLADQYNTVLKMSNKRSLVAAVLNVTAASDIFTQDLEDMPHFSPPEGAKAKPEAPKPATKESTEPPKNWVTILGKAILDYCNQDSKGAQEVLQDVAGVKTLTKMDQTTAKAAYMNFEKKYLMGQDGGKREPGEGE